MKRMTPFLLIGGLAAILIAVEVFRPRPYDERLRVERSGAEPFDAEMLYRLLPDWLDAPVEPADEPPFLVLEDTTRRNTLYLFLTDSFEPDEAEAGRLVAFAERGNTVLMVAEDFGGPLSWALGPAETLRRKQEQEAIQDSLDAIYSDEEMFDEDGEPLFEDDVEVDDDVLYYDGLDTDRFPFFMDSRLASSDTLQLVDPALTEDHPEGFVFSISISASGLVGIDSSRTAILGRNEAGEPTFVRVGVGEGAFLVSSTPLAFTNAALSEGDGDEYLEGVFGYIPDVDRVIWDERYKPLRAEGGSPLGVVSRTPPLLWAITLIVLGAFLFLFFRGRRWQRPIPVVAPPPNAQREFARTIGRLHFVNGDRGWLAKRKARVFEDHIRTRLGLPDADLSDASAKRAAARAGVDPEDALALFRRLRNLRADPSPEPDRLIAADQDIDTFFQRATAAQHARFDDPDTNGAAPNESGTSPVASPAAAPTA
ncbi:MAG: hypothetical protein Rubg2KO_27650 [Rubricoccaceae bacterium]